MSKVFEDLRDVADTLRDKRLAGIVYLGCDEIERLQAIKEDWATRICSAHQTPNPLCRICNPEIGQLERELAEAKQIASVASCVVVIRILA